MGEWRRCILNLKMAAIVLVFFLVALLFFANEQTRGFEGNLESLKQEYEQAYKKYSVLPIKDETLEALEQADAYEEVSYEAGVAESSLRKEFTYLVQYQEYLQDLYQRKEQVGDFAIFAKEDSFARKNIEKQAEDFASTSRANLGLANSMALEKALGYEMTNYFVLILLIILIMLFQKERKKGLWSTIHSSYHGRVRLTVNRLGILFLYSVVTTILFYVGIYILSCSLYGNITNYSFSIQSIALFRDCTFSLTIGEFLGVFLLLKCLAMFTLGLIVWGILSSFRNTNIGILVLIGIFGLEYFAFQAYGPNHRFNELKYMNLFLLLQLPVLFTEYCNMQVGPLFFSIKEGESLIWPILLILIISSTIVSNAAKRPCGGRTYFQNVILRIRKGVTKLFGNSTGVRSEFCKVLFCNKGIWIFAILLYIQVGTVSTTPVYYSTTNYQLYQYLEQYSGPLNEEVSNEMAQSVEEIEKNSKDYQIAVQQYQEGQISEEDLLVVQNRYEISGQKEKGLLRFQERLEDLQEYEEKTGIKVQIVNDFGYRYFYDELDRGGASLESLKAILFIILLSSCLIAYEKQSGMYPILHTTIQGRKKAIVQKYVTLFGLSLFVWCISYGIELYNMHVLFGFKNLDASIKSVSLFRGVPFDCSIGVFLFILYSLRFLGIFCAGAITMYVSSHFSQTKNATIYAILMIGGTSILYYIGIRQLQMVSILDSVNVLKEIGVAHAPNVVKLGVTYFVSGIAIVLCSKRWINTKS